MLREIREQTVRAVQELCELAGLEVKRLVRVREGGLRLNGLKTGKWRKLTKKEADKVFEK